MKRPELLSPAGSLEKLQVAILYGADAVYLAGQEFGLRTAADNFTMDEMRQGVLFARRHQAKVYVVINSYLHDNEIAKLPPYLDFLQELKIDALIVSDLGVVSAIRAYCSIPIHLSTQASCLNSWSARFWKSQGVERIVLGRETSIAEAREIKEKAGIEVEMFIHGSLCMAYSGNCVISNYTQGRDSNRGGCAHSCRFNYSYTDEGQKKEAYFMSSKDLNGLEIIDQFIEAGIDSLKIEGRMKSHHYAGTVTRSYRRAIDSYFELGQLDSQRIEESLFELGKVSHRDYTLASLINPAGSDSIYGEREHNSVEYVIAGVVMDVIEEQFLVVDVRSAFHPGTSLEAILFSGKSVCFSPEWVQRMSGSEVTKTGPGGLVKIPFVPGIQAKNLLRMAVGK